ncbi:DExH-box splicing factor binding site-domain-containing protein [Trametes polyzona]|nr:DExH-box splicing factor binding site-domain-containing protein [Trametes polyzona]
MFPTPVARLCRCAIRRKTCVCICNTTSTMASSSSAPPTKVSFTIRRPTPPSRTESESESFKVPPLPRHLSGNNTPNSPLARSTPPSPKRNSRTYTERDSSDEDSGPEDELVTGFDQFGVQRLHEKPKPQGPLVIPALKNRDWREFAHKRKQLYVPPSAAAVTGADGSVGGLGTRDTINSGPQLTGLQVKKKLKVEENEDEPMPEPEAQAPAPAGEEVKKEEETDDQKALRAILASAASGGDGGIDGPQIDIIPAPSEDDAYRQDVEELPESASLEDYERVPVSQFGAALLRGMGWKEGMAASKRGKGMVEPWLPQARPALLGIGAKEREVFDDGSKKKGGKARPERRYVPVIKKERREGGESESGREGSSRPRSPVSSSRHGSKRPSRSPSPDRRKDRDSRRDDRDRDRYRESDRERDKDRDRHREKRRDDEPSRRDRDRDRDRDYDSSRRERDRDRDYERERRRDRSAEKYDSRRKERY